MNNKYSYILIRNNDNNFNSFAYTLKKNKLLFRISKIKINNVFKILFFAILSILIVYFCFYYPQQIFSKNKFKINFNYRYEFFDDYNKTMKLNKYFKNYNLLTNISLKNELYNKTEINNTFTYLTKEMIIKFNYFINICQNDILIDNKKYPLLKIPKISVTIPLFNGGKYLYYSLRSVQNQNMKDIEIILVDDCSTDDTLNIINKYIIEDQRIKLIRNKKNRKILYSKSIAALNARGKYLIELDQDDEFIREDLFDLLFYEAEKHNLDLVQIRDIVSTDYYLYNLTRVNYVNKHIIFPKNTHYKIQPELRNSLFYDNNNYLLWGLLIKTDLYKKTIYHLWPIIINYKIVFQEDYIITFMLIILAKKYKYLNNFGLIHLVHQNSTSANYFNNNEFYLGILFAGNIIYDYYIKDNPKEIYILVNYFIFFQYYINIGKNLFPKLFKYILNKIINNKYLSNSSKIFFKHIFDISDRDRQNLENISFNNQKFTYFHFNHKKIKKLDSKKITISIIVVCFEYKYLIKTIDSIQSQNFINFEIILIYDNVDKKDLYLIKEYIKQFYNIKLINNGTQKGFIYSISLGIISSKGIYILILNPSNVFAKNNILNEFYNILKKNKNIDILEFNLLLSDDYLSNNSLNLYKCRHFTTEFNLTNIKYNINYKEIDLYEDLLINKMIKAELFKNIVNKYKFLQIKRTIYNYFENIFIFCLQNTNTNFKHLDTIGIIKNINNSKNLKVNNISNQRVQKIKDSIFYINFLFDNTNNTLKDKEIALNEYFNLMSIIYNRFNKISFESFNLYKKFINCKYISEFDKNTLILYYTSLNT